MADHDGWCQCPLLRFAAEMERLAKYGMVASADTPDHLVIAALRERYGCRGPRGDICPWTRQYPGLRLESDRNVPLLHSRPATPLDKSEERQYL